MYNLFENFGNIQNLSELQAIQTKHSKSDPIYVQFSCSIPNTEHEKTKEKINALYSNLKSFLDTDFAQKIKRDFGGAMWELYLGSVFLHHGITLNAKISRGPDFEVQLDSQKRIFVEATVAGRGEGMNKVAPIPLGGTKTTVDAFNNPRILRITSSFDYKYRKYFDPTHDHYTCISDLSSSPFIIGICSNFEDFDESVILNVAFSIGKSVFGITKDGKLRHLGFEDQPSIEKENQSNISVGVFNDDTYKEVSVIIYSRKPAISILDDLSGNDLYIREVS